MRIRNFIIFLIFSLVSVSVAEAVLLYSSKIGEDISSISFTKVDYVISQPKEENRMLSLFEDVKNTLISEKKDFLEANLDQMIIRVFREGVVVKQAPIIAKGELENWGGSAAGVYTILSGNKASFSNIAQAYMPYALHYFGKYYIHGEPYYPGGEKMDSAISGGCLRLDDKDAKEIYELANINMPVVVIDKEKGSYEYNQSRTLKALELSAKGYIVADLDSGYVFAEKEPQNAFPIFSLTQLATAVAVVEGVNLERSVAVEGKSFKVVEALYPLLLDSSEQAANALARSLGKQKTVRLMNEKAESILMSNTKFISSFGKEPENVSTPEDLFYLARYILNNRLPIFQITKGEKVRMFGEVSVDLKSFGGKVFFDDPDFIGGKIDRSEKENALTVFRLKNSEGAERNIALIVLDSADAKKDIDGLLLWLKGGYFK